MPYIEDSNSWTYIMLGVYRFNLPLKQNKKDKNYVFIIICMFKLCYWPDYSTYLSLGSPNFLKARPIRIKTRS